MYLTFNLNPILIIITDFQKALANKMPFYSADTCADEYDEDEFVLSAHGRVCVIHQRN